MPFTEAKEHAPGHLHEILADPYRAFDNTTTERLSHLRVAIAELIERPLRQGRLVLRVIYGWENGGSSPETLCHNEYRLISLDTLDTIEARLSKALELHGAYTGNHAGHHAESHAGNNTEGCGELLAKPLAVAISNAEQAGMTIDDETRQTPSRWPSFTDGLWLYTLFKVYHRLIYGEDDAYRSIHLRLPEGEREVHEFHLEEGDFAVIAPRGNSDADSLLVLHPSQLASVLRLFKAV